MYFVSKGSLGTLSLFFLVLVFSFGSSYSQGLNNRDDLFFNQINEQINRLINSHLVYIKNNNQYKPGNNFYNPIYMQSLSDSILDLDKAFIEANRKKISKDIGLQFSIGFVDNFTNGFSDLGFFYRRAAQAGFDWNFFKGGWYDSRFKAKEFYFDQQVKALQNRDKEIIEENNYLYNKLIEFFAQAKRHELLKMQSFTNEYVEISKKLYYKKLLLWDDILKLYSQQNEINNLLENFIQTEGETDSLSLAFSDYLPLLQINQSRLLENFDKVRNEDSIQHLHQEYLKYKYKTIRDLSLKPFVRYNYYDYTGIHPVNVSRDFVSAGFQFSVPLPLRAKDNSQLKSLEAGQFKFQNNQDFKNDFNELRGLYIEYQEKINNYLDLYYQKLVLEEVIRREQSKNTLKDPDYSPVFIARKLNDWYVVKYSMLEEKEDLYFLLIKMKSLIPGAQITDFTEEIDLNTKAESKKIKNKSIYVWSKTYSGIANEKLVRELKDQGINKVMLSINQDDSLKVKAYELNKLLMKEKIELHLMIANNDFIYAEKRQEFDQMMEYLLEIPGISGIHLDIEPHTVAAFKKDRNKYQSMYIELVSHARNMVKKKGMKLSVSIPLFYEKDKLEEIYLNADKVYLMAYEHSDVEFIKRKTAEELTINKEKSVIALRTQDFANRNSLDQMIQSLSSTLDISDFAIHDFKSLKELK